MHTQYNDARETIFITNIHTSKHKGRGRGSRGGTRYQSPSPPVPPSYSPSLSVSSLPLFSLSLSLSHSLRPSVPTSLTSFLPPSLPSCLPAFQGVNGWRRGGGILRNRPSRARTHAPARLSTARRRHARKPGTCSAGDVLGRGGREERRHDPGQGTRTPVRAGARAHTRTRARTDAASKREVRFGSGFRPPQTPPLRSPPLYPAPGPPRPASSPSVC